MDFDFASLTKREKILIALLVVQLVLMFFSRQPDTVGVDFALAMAWVALLLFVAMLAVLVFVKDDAMVHVSAKAAKEAARKASERAKARTARPSTSPDGFDDGLD